MMYDNITSVEDALRRINEGYARDGKYMVDGKPRYTAHAVQMENAHGLTGIAGRYKFVDGKEAAFAEYDYRKRFQKYQIAINFLNSDNPYCRQGAETMKDQLPAGLKEMNDEIGKLTVMNPELKALNFNKNNIVETYRALIGITSQYNPDDINSYLHSVRAGKKNPELLDRMDKIKKSSGVVFGWQPAAKTLDRIEAQLKEREKTNGAMTLAVSSKSASR